MEKSNHTPGPWISSLTGTTVTATVTREINGKIRTFEQKIATTPVGLDAFERVANAQLIAAAPDLLEALRGMLEVYGVRECSPFNNATLTEVELCDMARTAIDKATGTK